jgi:hypothetical protein
MSRASFNLWLVATAILLLAQSIAHILAAGPFGTVGSIVDLDRSNGIPDIVSTGAIAIAGIGAVALAWRSRRRERLSAAAVVACLGVIAVDDVVGVDKDAKAVAALAVTGVAIVAAAALAARDGRSGRRSAVMLTAGLAALVATLVVGQLPEIEQWFDRERGDPVFELQIIAKQDLELAGWALIALGLWNRALAATENRPGSPAPGRRTDSAGS